MTSAHVRRLQARVARTAARFTNFAAANGLAASDLPSAQLPWFEVREATTGGEGAAPDGGTPTILIFDEIGGSFGVSAKAFVTALESIDAPTIAVRINSPGGSLFDAIAIHNALLHHPARIVVYVDALAASAASVIAMAADELVMMPGSQLMIHDASAVEDGNAADMAHMSTFLDRQSDNVAEFYARRGGGPVADWRAAMLAETWMFAQEAVDAGLADRVAPAPVSASRDERMARSFDLTHFRYAGREHAPTPGRPGPTNTRAAVLSRTIRRPQGSAAMNNARHAAAVARREALAGGKRSASSARPCGDARAVPFAAKELRAELVDRDNRQFYRVHGYASVVEAPYQMWDTFGEYQEVIRAGAFDATLAAKPDVAFLVNHRGVTMARTTNGTLELSADSTGLHSVAFLNPERQDVRDLVSAISDQLITEMSFAFMIPEGAASWTDDWGTFEIAAVDINRGDVSGVNYGASPHTSIAARSLEIMRDLQKLPAGAAREAMYRLAEREDMQEVPVIAPELPHDPATSNSVSMYETLVEALEMGN